MAHERGERESKQHQHQHSEGRAGQEKELQEEDPAQGPHPKICETIDSRAN